ncbi:FlaA1/EpsC-like NDP-sugar epimerase [Lachnotalea glycerini]|uniref:FlaA1/EpsC-like NDP-sugar epimerase n=1 Tax=Lachnotalea glycerini TaxID=1763509 RepID=A0A318EXB0_9FIRM|nr:nucleoside-diphosphate sugar epimerase/dehydratase [Lachnotalea glycerini]PXV91452.1 FlaA1/EpsC-like NDP-sugar epimerase [Lachnotalea glycerini]
MRNYNLELYIKKVFFILYDMCAIIMACMLCLLIRFEFEIDNSNSVYFERTWKVLPTLTILTILIFYIFKMYSSIWKYAGAREMFYIACACGIAGILYPITVMVVIREKVPMPRSTYILYPIFLFILVCGIRYIYRLVRALIRMRVNEKAQKRVLIVGAGAAANALIKEINTSSHVEMVVVGLVDDDPSKRGSFLHGIKVMGNRNDISKLTEKLEVDKILIAIPTLSEGNLKEILNICKKTGCELQRLPGIYQLANGEVSVAKLKEVDVNDLLGREAIKVDLSTILEYVSDKVIMVTGGGGSIGSELCRQIAAYKPKKLIIVDIYENTTYDIQNELKQLFPGLELYVFIASVRNTKRIDKIFDEFRPDMVYHAAAHKHVPLMEDSPNEAVKNNVFGTWKVVQAADKYKIKRFVMISTDKAVNPTNIMGATKRICEMIIQTYNSRSQTEFVAVRFGNVLGSNGSVIPLFKKQITRGGPVTVTHPDIVRYFMTIPEAVSLVLQAGAYAKGGEIFVLDMGEPVKILDLAKNLILLSGHKPDEDIKIEFTGLRMGEKMYEELLMKEEGLQETDNQLIHIGKPIDMNEENFLKQLEELNNYVAEEPDDIREWVQRIVPTYSIQNK